jgi:hypothetical protein
MTPTALFLLRTPTHAANFESVLRSLARRGVDTTVIFEEGKPGDDEAGLALLHRLRAEYELVRHEPPMPPAATTTVRMRTVLEAIEDYLWYFDPPFDRADRLRARVLPRLPARVEATAAAALMRAPAARRRMASLARAVAARRGPDPRIRAELRRRRPDVVIASPLVHLRSRQNDWVLAARELGIPTLFCVHGWDDLMSKGVIHPQLDRIAVWNEAQRDEAIRLHGADPASISVVGAWPYDHWPGWEASRSRDELCRQLGLPASRALVLYVCSSRFIASAEAPAVAEWIGAIRNADDPRLARANVIVRPRLSTDSWEHEPLAALPGVAVFPRRGVAPVDERARSDYFDSIVLADVVVGVNTSALVESAILDRRALAYPPPRFSSTQDALPHFCQLVGPEGSVEASRSMDEHVRRLSHALAEPAAGADERRRFVSRFVHAGEPERPASERLAAVVEDLLAGSPARRSSARTAALR